MAKRPRALSGGGIAAIMGPRAELEAALQGQSGFSIDTVEMPELRVGNWPIGMAVKAEKWTWRVPCRRQWSN